MAAGIDRARLWEFMSYAWTEIGIEEDECLTLAREAGISPATLDEADRIVFRDICASFAVESFLVIPLMLWMILPDWGYDEAYLRRRMAAWYARPYWRHFLHPLRLPGYPVALLFALGYRRKLHRAVRMNALIEDARRGPSSTSAAP